MNRMLLGYSPDLDVFDDAAGTTTARHVARVRTRGDRVALVAETDETEQAAELLDAAQRHGVSAWLAQRLRAVASAAGRAPNPTVHAELMRWLERRIILDVVEVVIGDGTQIGPAVQIYAADHPRDAETRKTGLEFGRPVRIGKDVWIGGGAIILPGITIGDGAVIGAGSVVTRDVATGQTVAGNPARPKRTD